MGHIKLLCIFRMEESAPDGNIEVATNIESSGSNVTCKDASQVKYRQTLIM